MVEFSMDVKSVFRRPPSVRTPVLLMFSLFATFLFHNSLMAQKPDSVCFKNGCFLVEVARTPQERAQGLMFREKLEKNRGMLFIFEEESRRSFWMKNTFIPLDIIWINKNGIVVFVSKNASPCKDEPCPLYNPHDAALYVIEINAGLARQMGIVPGEKATLLIGDKKDTGF